MSRARAILFLDVDGVLNSDDTRPGAGVREVKLARPFSADYFTGLIETEKLAALLGKVEECNARIVVSSSWRTVFDSAAAFAGAIGVSQACDLADLFHRDWRTEMKFSASRIQEIGLWLADHRSVSRFAILDDHDVCFARPEFERRFVRTDAKRGLTAADLERIGALLGYPNLN